MKFENYGLKLMPENLRQFDPITLKLSDYLVCFEELREGFLDKFMLICYIALMPLFQIWILYSNIRYDEFSIFGIVMCVLSVIFVGWVLNALVFDAESDLAYRYLEGKSKFYMHITFAGIVLMLVNQVWAGALGILVLLGLILICYLAPFLCRYAIAVMYDEFEGHPDTTYDPDREDDVWEEGWGKAEVEYEDEEDEDAVPEVGSDKAWNQEVMFNMEQTRQERMMQGRRTKH